MEINSNLKDAQGQIEPTDDQGPDSSHQAPQEASEKAVDHGAK